MPKLAGSAILQIIRCSENRDDGPSMIKRPQKAKMNDSIQTGD